MENFIATLVQLDPKIQEFIAWVVGIVIAWLFLQLANTPALKWLALYLGPYKVGIVAWLTNLIVQLIQTQLNKIPLSWESVAYLAMQLIVAVIITLMAFAFIRRSNKFGAAALV